MNTHKSDPIVAEIRAIRAKQAARFENDPAAIIRHARALQKASGRKLRPVCRSSFGARHLVSITDFPAMPSLRVVSRRT